MISLRAMDVPAAAHFYRDVLGLPLMGHFTGDRPHFDLGGTLLTILPGQPALPPNPQPRFPVVAFSIPDLESALDRLRAHKVDLPWGVEENSGSRWVMFHDPGGNLVELVEFIHQERPGSPA